MEIVRPKGAMGFAILYVKQRNHRHSPFLSSNFHLTNCYLPLFYKFVPFMILMTCIYFDLHCCFREVEEKRKRFDSDLEEVIKEVYTYITI